MMNAGRFEEAIVLFEQSISDDPHFKTLELLGECFIKLNRPVEAIVPLAAAVALNKGVRAPSLLAEVFLRLDKHRAAKEMAEIALSRNANNRKALEIIKAASQFAGAE